MGLISGQASPARLKAKCLEASLRIRPDAYMALAGTCYKGVPDRNSSLLW
jgi:hypothetical protein